MEQISGILHAMCKRVGSPTALRVSALVQAGEWDELQSLKLNPTTYPDAESYWRDAMCVDFLRKAAIGGSGRKQVLAAIDTFLETERDCAAVNRMVRSLFREKEGYSLSELALADFLVRWRKKISSILGKVPEVLVPRFSGGATTATTRLWSTTIDKLSTTPTYYSHSSTATKLWFWSSAWGTIAVNRNLPPRESLGNDYFTVPKTGLTDRSACKEASIPGVLQLAIGRWMRGRLRVHAKLDLNRDAERHQRLAQEASLHGHLATLDMSSASDRWARELVRFLLPRDWTELLDETRATHTLFHGKGGPKRLYLEKFSSMGNGYTFELETILFWTLAEVVRDEEGVTGVISCYGDDLIVPSELAQPVIRTLAAFGQQANLRKTFAEGPFRESCGGDFFIGVAVNTVKVEEVPSEPHQWISLANNLRRVAWGQRYERWALIKPIWEAVLQQLPTHIRSCRGPSQLGDAVIHDLPRFWTNSRTVADKGLHRERVFLRAWVPVVKRRNLGYYKDTPLAQIVAMTMSAEPLTKGIPLREVEGYRLRWLEFGPGCDWLPSPPLVV